MHPLINKLIKNLILFGFICGSLVRCGCILGESAPFNINTYQPSLNGETLVFSTQFSDKFEEEGLYISNSQNSLVTLVDPGIVGEIFVSDDGKTVIYGIIDIDYPASKATGDNHDVRSVPNSFRLMRYDVANGQKQEIAINSPVFSPANDNIIEAFDFNSMTIIINVANKSLAGHIANLQLSLDSFEAFTEIKLDGEWLFAINAQGDLIRSNLINDQLQVIKDVPVINTIAAYNIVASTYVLTENVDNLSELINLSNLQIKSLKTATNQPLPKIGVTDFLVSPTKQSVLYKNIESDLLIINLNTGIGKVTHDNENQDTLYGFAYTGEAENFLAVIQVGEIKKIIIHANDERDYRDEQIKLIKNPLDANPTVVVSEVYANGIDQPAANNLVIDTLNQRLLMQVRTLEILQTDKYTSEITAWDFSDLSSKSIFDFNRNFNSMKLAGNHLFINTKDNGFLSSGEVLFSLDLNANNLSLNQVTPQ